MKNLKKSKTPKESNFKRHIFVLYVAALVLLLGLAGVVGLLYQPLKRDFDNTYVISTAVKDALLGLSRPMVVDPQEKKLYVYEASVRFKADPERQLRYGYFKDADSRVQIQVTNEALLRHVISQLNKDDVNDVFNNVPAAQACSRAFIIEFQEGTDFDGEYEQVKTVSLADGRTAFINQNKACAEAYGATDDIAKDLAVLETIESY